MKIHFYKLLLLVSVFAASCKKDETQVLFQGGTAPVLSADIPNNGIIPLSDANKDNVAVVLKWTNPNYQFTTGVSSMDVNYAIEIDTTGSNFASSTKKTISRTKILSDGITAGVLNDILQNNLGFTDTSKTKSFDVRIVSSLDGGNGILYSNTYTFKAKTYAIPPKIALPASGELYITGAATPAGWMSNGDAPLATQKFTKVSNTMFELQLNLNGGASYLLVPKYGDWGDKYGGVGVNNSNNPDADDFKQGGGDLKAPTANGLYKIQVDFQTGRYSLTKL